MINDYLICHIPKKGKKPQVMITGNAPLYELEQKFGAHGEVPPEIFGMGFPEIVEVEMNEEGYQRGFEILGRPDELNLSKVHARFEHGKVIFPTTQIGYVNLARIARESMTPQAKKDSTEETSPSYLTDYCGVPKKEVLPFIPKKVKDTFPGKKGLMDLEAGVISQHLSL